jgi:hypothetical protein
LKKDQKFTHTKNGYQHLLHLSLSIALSNTDTHLIRVLYRCGHTQIRQPICQLNDKQVRVCAVARGEKCRHGQLIAVVGVGQAAAPQLRADVE